MLASAADLLRAVCGARKTEVTITAYLALSGVAATVLAIRAFFAFYLPVSVVELAVRAVDAEDLSYLVLIGAGSGVSAAS